MNTKEAILDIIKINKLIVDDKIDKHLPRTKEMQEAYNNSVKPLLKNFREKYGKTERAFIKDILEESNFNRIGHLKIKTFGNWGRKINPYIWASIFIENEQNSASNSLQLYININSEGMKFGFDYGDKIENTHSQVEDVKNNKASQKIILEAINKNDLDVISIKAGSPKALYEHKKSENIIKTIDDFINWGNDIHIIKSYPIENIPNNIENEILDVINSF